MRGTRSGRGGAGSDRDAGVGCAATGGPGSVDGVVGRRLLPAWMGAGGSSRSSTHGGATHFSLASCCVTSAPTRTGRTGAACGGTRAGCRPLVCPDGPLYFDGETEPCINGMALASGAYLGQEVEEDRRAPGLGDQLPDGGWNCWAEFGATVSSFHSTTVRPGRVCSEWERASGTPTRVGAGAARGEEYLLQRKLFRRLSTGEVADPGFTLFSFPTRWYYDVLRGLEYSGRGRAGTVAPKRSTWWSEGGRIRPLAAGEHAPGSDAVRLRGIPDGSPADGTPCGPCGCCGGGRRPEAAGRSGRIDSGPWSRSRRTRSPGDRRPSFCRSRTPATRGWASRNQTAMSRSGYKRTQNGRRWIYLDMCPRMRRDDG